MPGGPGRSLSLLLLLPPGEEDSVDQARASPKEQMLEHVAVRSDVAIKALVLHSPGETVGQ